MPPALVGSHNVHATNGAAHNFGGDLNPSAGNLLIVGAIGSRDFLQAIWVAAGFTSAGDEYPASPSIPASFLYAVSAGSDAPNLTVGSGSPGDADSYCAEVSGATPSGDVGSESNDGDVGVNFVTSPAFVTAAEAIALVLFNFAGDSGQPTSLDAAPSGCTRLDSGFATAEYGNWYAYDLLYVPAAQAVAEYKANAPAAPNSDSGSRVGWVELGAGTPPPVAGVTESFEFRSRRVTFKGLPYEVTAEMLAQDHERNLHG